MIPAHRIKHSEHCAVHFGWRCTCDRDYLARDVARDLARVAIGTVLVLAGILVLAAVLS